MTFGEKVKKAREYNGLTQQQLANRVGISKRAVAAYECGQSKARNTTIWKLAEAMNVTYDYLTDENAVNPAEVTNSSDFVSMASERYGNRGKHEAEELVGGLIGLFAGGELSETDKDAVMISLQKAYFECKEESMKFTPKIPNKKY